MLYTKNLPLWERALRVAAGIIVIVLTLAMNLESWMSMLAIASAGTFLFFGLVGFCPMCALAGRKPAAGNPTL